MYTNQITRQLRKKKQDTNNKTKEEYRISIYSGFQGETIYFTLKIK